jgi:hypothetical protein
MSRYASIWRQRLARFCRWLWTHHIALIGALIASIGLIIAFLTWQLSTTQDARERNFKFHEVTLEAEHLYCLTIDSGVRANVKILIDQAVNLEPGINDQLSPLNYITLAAIGSLVLSHDQAHEYGQRGLELAQNSSKNTIDEYAANLVLGHIDFLRYDRSADPLCLEEGRTHFRQALNLVSDSDSNQDLHFVGQVCLIWAVNEVFFVDHDAGAKPLQLARNAWGKLPQRDGRLKFIDAQIEDTEKGVQPRLPCPSLIAVSPPLFAAAIDTDSQDNGGIIPLLDRATGNDVTFEFDKRFDSLASELNELKAANDQLAKQVVYLASRLPADNASPPSTVPPMTPSNDGDGGEVKPNLPADGLSPPLIPIPESQRPAPHPGQNPPGRDRVRYAFTIFNRTYDDVRLSINDRTHAAWVAPAGGKRSFNLRGNSSLRISRQDTGETKTWKQSIFWRQDGSQRHPVFIITSCCLLMMDDAANQQLIQ